MAAFQLSKWYLDCVTDSGKTFIAYVGDLHWGPLHLHYSSLLRSEQNAVTQQNSLRQPSMPVLDGKSMSWNSDHFDFSAVWQSDLSELRQTVFTSEEGSVEWHCLIPVAQVRTNGDSGLGYVEHLTMTVAPWKIPIQNLRWGRFGSASDWVVWIDWQGEFSKRILYRNGETVSASTLDDQQITFADGSRLTMDRSLILRNGPLGTTALSSIPGVTNTFPARLLQINECKWRSRATLECRGRPVVEGWAIHEIVSWPK